jgi:hypothetical protein
VTATSGLPPDAAPAGGLLARHRTAIARFGTDVAAAGGIGPALAAGLDPADYPVVPGGVPQAWERAQVYLGLCERYQAPSGRIFTHRHAWGEHPQLAAAKVEHSAEIASNPASMRARARCYGRLCPGSGMPLSQRMRLAAREWL